MSLNWNAFLTDEGLSIPSEQWTDNAQANGRSAGPSTAGTTNTTAVDDYFDDNFFNSNEYLLSDFEILQPLGNANMDGSTSESSPEASGLALDDHDNFKAIKVETSSASQTPASISSSTRTSPVTTARPNRARQSSQTLLNPIYESHFPNVLNTGFVEDLTFPNGLVGVGGAPTSPVERLAKNESEMTNKRNKAQTDILSACWTSPLCPNHDQNGPPPNPSTCGGGCAPFLFAESDDLPNPGLDMDRIAKEITLQDVPEGVVEIKSRQRKRTESEVSSEELSGRQFPKATTTETEEESRAKSEASQESPEQVPIEEDKSKTRRRLPHNQVERKYRESLNTQLESLRRVVPALKQNLRGCEGADIEDLPTPSKPSKAVVLASATAYIKQMEKDKKNLAEENEALKQRVKALQALVKCDDCQLRNYFIEMKIAQQA